MSLFFWSSVFILSLFVLIKASDYFTASAEEIGVKLGVSQFVIGATVVSIGTSLPELVSSVVAVLAKTPEIVAGNVVGSNIANILLILAVGAIFSKKRLHIEKKLLPVDIPMLIGSALFLAVTVYDDHEFSRGEAILFVLAMVVFILYNIKESRTSRKEARQLARSRRTSTADVTNSPQDSPVPSARLPLKPLVILPVSVVFVFIGAKFTVDSIVEIANIIKVGAGIIAVTAVALGTSLPELSVTYSAAKKGNGAIVVGNVLGSNVFNTFAVMGIPGLMASLPFPPELVVPGLVMMIVATVMFLVVIVDQDVGRWEGLLFLLMYVYFIGKTFHLL